MKIVVLDGYTLNPGDLSWRDLEGCGELVVYDRTPRELVVERALGAEVILTNKTPLPAEVLAELPDLKMISVLATGYNIVDVVAAGRQGVVVCNVPGYSTDSVAELVMAMVMDFYKMVRSHSQWVHEGEWQRCEDFSFWRNPMFQELAGKTIGVIGFGEIGQRVGALAAAFRMKVLANNRRRQASVRYDFEWASLEEIYRESDVISLHCPLTAETQGLVGREQLGMMKPSAFLVNTARGPLVDEQALADALNAGVIAGAACDVVSREPILAENPLLTAKNLLLTPHIGWAAYEARVRLMAMTVENVRAYQAGQPIHVVL